CEKKDVLAGRRRSDVDALKRAPVVRKGCPTSENVRQSWRFSPACNEVEDERDFQIGRTFTGRVDVAIHAGRRRNHRARENARTLRADKHPATTHVRKFRVEDSPMERARGPRCGTTVTKRSKRARMSGGTARM